MILSDKTIRAMLAAGQLSVTPLEDFQIQPASIDVRLGDSFAIQKAGQGAVDMESKIPYTVLRQDTFLLEPKGFVLGTTMEYFRLPPNLTAFVEGRSSIGRLGLFVQNAGWVDPGFEGAITLELFNAGSSPIVLTAGRRVGQMVFAQLDRDAAAPYCGKYQGQREATGSKIYLDEEGKKDARCCFKGIRSRG